MAIQNKRILVVGSIALDSVKTPFGKAREVLGGSASYFSSSARFFSKVSVIGVVGQDFPKKHLLTLAHFGADTSGIEVQPGKTFRWKGFYGYDLNNAQTLKTDLNVFASFRPKISPNLANSSHLFLANIDPEIQLSVLSQVRAPELTACDTMNFWIEKKPKALNSLLSKVTIFLCNDSEARELTGEHNLVRAAKDILRRGPKVIVIKKGEHGVLCFTRSFAFAAPAFMLEDIFDPTGAGDTFAGGFIGYLSQKRKISESELRKAVIYGSVLASFNVENFSLERLIHLKMSEIRSRYSEFRELTRF